MSNTFTASRGVNANEMNRITGAIDGTFVFPSTAGGAVTPSSGMTIAVAAISAGMVTINGTVETTAYAGGTVNVTAADATNPRRDLVYYDTSGSVGVAAGSAAATPFVPTLTSTQIAVAEIYVAANDTSIDAGDIIDRRQAHPHTVRLAGSSLAEVSTTSTSLVDLITISGLNIPVTSGVRITGQFSRTGGAGANVGAIGFEINGTAISTPSATTGIGFTTNTNQAEDGYFVVEIGPRGTDYLSGWTGHFACKVSATGAVAVAEQFAVPGTTNPIPNAAITSITITAINNTNNVNIAAANIKVYEVL